MSRHLPEDVRALLVAYRRLLEQSFGDRIAALWLFGSRARGDAHEGSDVDVVVAIRGVSDDERARAIDLAMDAWREAGRGGPLLSPLVWHEGELERRATTGRRLALDVMREGIAV